MTMTADALSSPRFAAPRGLALGFAGAVAFGAAAGLGHGVAALARGAWMSPALFVGGALLAAPPLYLAASYSGSRASAEEVIAEIADVLGRAGVALLGLAAPAAFFSATLRTPTAWALLVGLAVVVGAVAVRAIARRTLAHALGPAWLWTAFALALGVRLVLALATYTPVAHLVSR
jgi:hypothetical protein